MSETKFGLSQVDNPTPSRINLYVRAFTIAASVFMAWMSTVDFIGVQTSKYIYGILGLIVTLINSLAPLFGIQINPDSYVKAKEVSAIDEKKDDE